jgi:hypothetical protein
MKAMGNAMTANDEIHERKPISHTETSEPVLKLAGGLRRGILTVAKAASSEHPRSGL